MNYEQGIFQRRRLVSQGDSITQGPMALPSGAYVGPGDVVAATRWWGMRAYTFATRGQILLQIQRDSDFQTQDIASLANGALDIATIAAFIAPAPGTGKIIIFYNQVSGSASFTVTSNAVAPLYTANALNGFSAAEFVAASSLRMKNTTSLGIAQPLSIVAVAKHTDTSSTPTQAIVAGGVSLGYISTAANQAYIYAGGSGAPVGTPSDLHWHSLVGTIAIAGTGTGNFYVDGGLSGGPTTNTGTVDLQNADYYIGASTVPDSFANMQLTEVGFYNSELTPTQVSNLHSNITGFYGSLP